MLGIIQPRTFCLLMFCPKIQKIGVHNAIILSVFLCGCETCSLSLGEEHFLRMFENRVLRIFGPQRDEVTGVWRKLHNQVICDLYSCVSIPKIIKFGIYKMLILFNRCTAVGFLSSAQLHRVSYIVMLSHYPCLLHWSSFNARS
jgi:hypothetical protein